MHTVSLCSKLALCFIKLLAMVASPLAALIISAVTPL